MKMVSYTIAVGRHRTSIRLHVLYELGVEERGSENTCILQEIWPTESTTWWEYEYVSRLK